MKIQYQSDLHFEFGINRALFNKHKYRKVYGDVLVIAGDLDYLTSDGIYRKYTLDYLNWAGDNFERVLVVPGNHEYWGEKPFGLEHAQLPFQINISSNVSIGSNVVIEHKGVKFALSTLWSHIALGIQQYLNSNERRWVRLNGNPPTLDDANRIHQKCVDFLSNVEADVVVTHHAPTYKSMHPAYTISKDNEQFYNNLEKLIFKIEPKVWIFGHAHFTNREALKVFDPIKIVSNPLGYTWEENTGYKRDAILEI